MIRYKVICPLNGFIVPFDLAVDHKKANGILRELIDQLTDGIPFFNGIKLRRISKEDIEDLKPHASYPYSSTAELSPDMFVLEKNITFEDVDGVPHFPLNDDMRRIILAMRLLKKGYVSTSGIFYILLSKKRQLEAWSIEGANKLAEFQSEEYALKIEETPHLQKLVERVGGLNFEKQRSLGIACRRFEHTYEEEGVGDKLIDYMIAFEALFLRGEKAPAPGKVIATACSVLLGTSEKERRKIRETLTKAYFLRNRVVHGAECKEKIKDVTISEIEDYLRESIKRFLD